MRTAFHAGLWTSENAKRIAKEIDCAENLGRLETIKHEIEMKGNDM